METATKTAFETTTVNSMKFRKALEVALSCSGENTRYRLDVVQIVGRHGHMTINATDGRRLATSTMDAEVSGDFDALIQVKEVRQIIKRLQKRDRNKPATIEVGDLSFEFRHGNRHLIANLAQGRFPRISDILPTREPECTFVAVGAPRLNYFGDNTEMTISDCAPAQYRATNLATWNASEVEGSTRVILNFELIHGWCTEFHEMEKFSVRVHGPNSPTVIECRNGQYRFAAMPLSK